MMTKAKPYMLNHCFHWGGYDYRTETLLEQCCNCGKVIPEIERWTTETGKCEWDERWVE